MTDQVNTQLFQQYLLGNKTAEAKLYSLAYTRLKDIAHATRAQSAQRHGEGNKVLSDSISATTALVHDAYVKLNHLSKDSLNTQRDFYLLAAKAMQQILIDNSRALAAQKRQPLQEPKPQSSATVSEMVGLVSFEKALDRFSARYPRQSDALKLKYYIGLTISEISLLLGCSDSLVEKDIRFSRAWLQSRLSAQLY
ncbi:sigma-70 family RNA polymerase sigma factor [Vibrio astriarenae]|uniref:Sigma-70 family RNA polymerase sigma factor n=1 Tax=Vibrio astriarenae TaxID=1481923 RepID=A0A7Z2T592_9VIBR|nr:ECF-type sigma factor [Vibrio astriarenae]QIA64572.1 sigma-70 family RNA polymerase sigma factor [Vibrio astriarenae]